MKKTAKRWGIQIFEYYIGGNHIHLALQVPSREAYTGFIKALTGTLATALKIAFDHRPWTRLVTWGRDFKNLCRYIRRNFSESVGTMTYMPRGKFRKKWVERNAAPTCQD